MFCCVGFFLSTMQRYVLIFVRAIALGRKRYFEDESVFWFRLWDENWDDFLFVGRKWGSDQW